MEDFIVPVALFGSIFGIIAVVTYFRFRGQREMQETVRTLLQSGQPMSEDSLSELMAALSPREQDLRRGLISISIAIAVAVFAFGVGEEEAIYPLLGIAAFPLFIGCAYFLLYQMAGKKGEG